MPFHKKYNYDPNAPTTAYGVMQGCAGSMTGASRDPLKNLFGTHSPQTSPARGSINGLSGGMSPVMQAGAAMLQGNKPNRLF